MLIPPARTWSSQARSQLNPGQTHASSGEGVRGKRKLLRRAGMVIPSHAAADAAGWP